MAATLLQEKQKQPAIPKLAQDLIAGTVGGWAQVVVGTFCHLYSRFRSNQDLLV